MLDVLLETGIDQFALHQRQRRLVVQLEIAEGVGEYLRHPDQAGLDVADEEQVNGAEQETADADREPDQRQVVQVIASGDGTLERADAQRSRARWKKAWKKLASPKLRSWM